MKPVVTELVLYPQHYHQAAGHADGQSGDIYQRIGFVPGQVS
jgi:hypothetical protein